MIFNSVDQFFSKALVIYKRYPRCQMLSSLPDKTNLQSVTKNLGPIPPQISMLCGDVTAFGWTAFVIQVACTSDTTFSWEKGVFD